MGRDITELKKTREALKAANQQLEATNQQLRAGEQQLKAANQQLRAGEQQLRAANQQLGASNQQLRASEKQLREEREKEQKYLDVAGTMMVVIDPEQKVTLINKKGCEILGYEEEEILGRNWFDSFLSESVRKEAKAVFQQLMAGEIGPVEYNESLVLTKGGQERIIAWHNAVLTDENGNIVDVLISGADITERRKAEQALRAANQQLRASEQQLKATNQQLHASEQQLLDYQAQLKSLASQLTLVKESERRRIATELHATIGQSLAVSKLQLDVLRQSVSDKKLVKALDEVCNTLGETIQDTRTLTFDLSSPILYELSFEAAVNEWLDERVRKKHRIATEFEDDGQPKPLDDDIRVLLFRDVRELLINVVKHARAKKVKVSVRRVGRQIHVGVEDDGWGFDPAKVRATAVKKGGFGLFSIRERLEQIGGELEIDSAPGHGTKVTVVAPLKQDQINDGGQK
ncbi:hypothetical protein ES703_44155 [subsurface metagenome]